jgi:RimJ/RimL family protein N-acetyltransferase
MENERMIPRLDTPRLMLRAFTEHDLDAWAAVMADADVARYIAPAPMTRDESWRSMAAALGHWMLRGYGTWAVEVKATGEMVGRVGMINPEGWPGLEIGWTLGKAAWGKGYATEAAEAAIRYAFLTQPVDRLISCIDPDNAPSQKVAVRVGETRGERTALHVGGKDYPVDIWAITRAEWLKRPA